VYNVGEPDALGEAQWVRAIGDAGWPGEVVILPQALIERAPQPLPDWLHLKIHTDQHWVVDTTRIRQDLGYLEVVPRDVALRYSVAWERANPPAPSGRTPPRRGPSAEELRQQHEEEDRVLAWLDGARQHGGAPVPSTE
jgi:hypothetical protein